MMKLNKNQINEILNEVNYNIKRDLPEFINILPILGVSVAFDIEPVLEAQPDLKNIVMAYIGSTSDITPSKIEYNYNSDEGISLIEIHDDITLEDIINYAKYAYYGNSNQNIMMHNILKYLDTSSDVIGILSIFDDDIVKDTITLMKKEIANGIDHSNILNQLLEDESLEYFMKHNNNAIVTAVECATIKNITSDNSELLFDALLYVSCGLM